MFESRADYQVALLKVLDELPYRQGKVSDVVEIFATRYHDHLPESFQEEHSNDERWKEAVRLSVRSGMIDSPTKGVWRLTELGHTWLKEHPEAQPTAEKHGLPAAGKARVEKNVDVESNITAQSIDRRRRLTRAASAEQSSSNRHYVIVDREIKSIRDFLSGHTSHRPSSEQLCDWVRFCYTLEMYSEARELYALINPADVNAWHFERTRKLAAICKMKDR